MSTNPKNEDQFNKNINEIIDEAVENAESRRELSENELDEVAGGVRFGPPTIGLIKEDNTI